MNETIRKFGWPETLVREYDHWLLLLRPAQPTLGSLVLASKSDACAFGDLPDGAHAELQTVTRALEQALKTFTQWEKINYLMLMMVDREVHFHVIPRYEGARTWDAVDFIDEGWPAQPRLDRALALDASQIARLVKDIQAAF